MKEGQPMPRRLRRRLLVALASAAVLGYAAATRPADDPALLAAGRALCDAFERGDTDAIFARMTPAAREAVGGTAAGLADLRERVLREDGPESGVIVEETRAAAGNRVYRRIARRNVGQTPTLMEWTLDAQERVVELAIRPQPVAIPSGKSNY